MQEKSGTIELRAGVHQVTLEMFENGGDSGTFGRSIHTRPSGMIFSYSGPDTGDKMVLVPPCAMTPAAPGTD
eukprot:2192849-Amphidinium_carterae.1